MHPEPQSSTTERAGRDTRDQLLDLRFRRDQLHKCLPRGMSEKQQNVCNSSLRCARHLVVAVVLTLSFASPLLGSPAAADSDSQETFPVVMQVDATSRLGVLRPIWRFFGADEPNYATLPNGRKLLGELGELSPKQVYFRAHNLLCSGDGIPALKWGSTGVYREDAQGDPVYEWTLLDEIFDTYLANGVRPYAQIGFMPRDLSTRFEPYQHQWTPDLAYGEIFTGWAYPPKDYQRWADLVHAWVTHCIARYGRGEVENWYWETWNEANIPYWQGTPQEFHKLHDFAIDAVRRALPTARVGGPDCAGHGGRWMRQFLDHCLRGTNYATGVIGTPIDFVAFHAKGSPVFTNGHVRMGIANQLRTINEGFRLVASYPELKNTPIVIGESDPEGCAACQGPQLGYRNGTMYSSYTAASFARKHDLADRHAVNFEGALTWAFQFENQPYFAGFRSLASNGIDKPVLNAFRMMAKMQGQRVPVSSDSAVPLDAILKQGVRERPDVAGLASMDDQRLWILLWHYHDDDVPGPSAQVQLDLRGLPASSDSFSIEHFRVDHDHSNAYTRWQQMGSPQQPTDQQVAELEQAGHLAQLAEPAYVAVNQNSATLSLDLPRQAVSLLVFKLP